MSVASSPTVTVDPSAASTSNEGAPVQPGQRQGRGDLPVGEVVQGHDRHVVDVRPVGEHRRGVRAGITTWTVPQASSGQAR